MIRKYLKDEFTEWIGKKQRKNGKVYSESTQNNYIYALEKKCNQIKKLNIENKDLFNITSFEEFKIIDKIIKENTDFQRVYEEDHGTLSAAMNQYNNFLKEKEIQGKSNVEEGNNELKFNNSSVKKIKEQYNRLVYGAPGTGKSNLLKQDIKKYNIDDEHYDRVTFYPDYSYGQFIGMYKPISEGDTIKYKFIAGPFLRLLAKALKSKENGTNEDFVLIVEEINRANAAYVFGDMFQLLDRDENGKSEYYISISKDIEKFLKEDEKLNISKLYLPDNFYIWSTMNSGDQGVMALDSAFKRRFDEYKLVGINENEDIIKGIKVDINGVGSNVEWNDFRKALNTYLIETFNIKEDKLIGPFFIKPKVLKDSVLFDRAFQDKLLMYLAEDVLNHNKQRLFGTNSLSKIKENYQCDYVFTEEFLSSIIDLDNTEIDISNIEIEQS